MRHGIKGRKLSRSSAHRKSTMQSLAMALIREHRIVTTVAKAKELRMFVEPLITRAKEDTHHNRRQVFSSLQNKDAVTELFTEIGPQCKGRPGGYTRVIKAGFRKGDGAELAVIELVDYNDIKPEGSSSEKTKKTRRAGKTNTPTSSPKVEEKEAAKQDDVSDKADVDDVSAEDAAPEEGESDDEGSEEEKK